LGAGRSGGCGPSGTLRAVHGETLCGAGLYGDEHAEAVGAGALGASLGCGVPTAVADLHEGESVLALGSGAGADVLISARRVGPTGTAIGLDMTDEMLELARRNAAAAGVENVEFLKGYLEELPLPDASVDVVLSNCVINLSGDKHQSLHEASRVLRAAVSPRSAGKARVGTSAARARSRAVASGLRGTGRQGRRPRALSPPARRTGRQLPPEMAWFPSRPKLLAVARSHPCSRSRQLQSCLRAPSPWSSAALATRSRPPWSGTCWWRRTAVPRPGIAGAERDDAAGRTSAS